jgi:hypothetical protein
VGGRTNLAVERDSVARKNNHNQHHSKNAKTLLNLP